MNQTKKSHKQRQSPRIQAIGMLLLLTSFTASATDWTSISKAKEYEMLVDMDSYNESDGHPYITTKTIYKKLQKYQKNKIKFTYIESHTTSQFNCVTHLYRNTAVSFYDQKSKLVGTEKGNIKFEPTIHDSTNNSLEGLVCQVQRMVGGQ